MYKLTCAFEKSCGRTDFISGLEVAFAKILRIDCVKIYLLDDFSYVLKDFEKPWENLADNEQNQKIQKVLNSFVGSKDSAKCDKDVIYMPVYENTKIYFPMRRMLAPRGGGKNPRRRSHRQRRNRPDWSGRGS